MPEKNIDIEKSIVSLLKEEGKVVLPDLGRFSSREIPASKQQDGTIVPPSNSYSFSSVLKKDDSVLVKYIAKKETTTQKKAKEEITKFVEEIQNTLKEGKEYSLSFGTLTMSKLGLISFVSSSEKKNFGLTPVKMNGLEKKKVEKKSNKGLIIGIIIGVVVLAGLGVAGYIYFMQTPPPPPPVVKPKPVVKKAPPPPPVKKPKPVEVRKPKYVNNDYQVEKGGFYYVVDGSFAYKLNAEKRLSQIKSQFPKAMIFRNHYRLYYVAADYFETQEEADQFAQAQAQGKGLWVKKY